MTVLQVVKGLTPGREFPVEGDRSIVGRHPECDIVLEVAAVSRQHAQILHEDGTYLLEDLGSRNGTYLNGNRISDRAPLRQGDRVVICDVSFDFFVEQPSEMLAGPMLGPASSMVVLIDDEEDSNSSSTMTSKLDVSSSWSGLYLTAKPEAKLAAMIEIAQNLGGAVSMEDVLPKLLDGLFKIFLQADRGFVILKSPDGALVPQAVKHRRAGDDQEARVSRTVIQQAMNGKEVILSADAASDERFQMAESISDFNIRSMMCAPLIDSEGVALGAIQIDTLDQRSRFTEGDLEVLASVASQAAIAVDNAQLHEKSLAQQSIQRDLELARQVQRGLMPSEHPQVPGYHFFHFYEPANHVGGDYYDYIMLPDGRVAVALGDVSGKGVAAALLMAKLSSEVRFHLASQKDPAVAVTRINATFTQSVWQDRFITFVVAVLDPENEQMTLVNAGHMAPLLRDSSGNVELIGEEETGLPLGVVDDYEYESYTRSINRGDFVTLFTDGISEAMNAAGELYGLEQLGRKIGAKTVSVADLGQHILDDVREFVGGHPQSDDMCLACFGHDD